MMNNPKSPNETPPEPPRENATPEAPFFGFAALMHRSVERLAEMQKLTLDVATRNTSDAIQVIKKATNIAANPPMVSLFDLVDQGVLKMAEAQKGVIDLTVQQSARVLEIARIRSDSASRYAGTAGDLLNATTDTVTSAQKILLDFAAEQNKAVANTIKQQAVVAGSAPAVAAVETYQRNMDMVIQTQKEMVQAAAKPMKAAATAPAA
jgi:hypothetical protein